MSIEQTWTTVFEPMTEPEYAAYVVTAIAAFARDKVASGQWADAQAVDQAMAAYSELLPRGVLTPKHHLHTLRDAASMAKVGVLWYAVEEQAGKPVAYVYDLLVHPEHRRKGHASRALSLLEREARERGLCGIALHVFGHNVGAHDLYVRLGFRATNISMFKPIASRACDTSGRREPLPDVVARPQRNDDRQADPRFPDDRAPASGRIV